MLWPEDMEGAKVVVALSFHDDLVPVHQVVAQVTHMPTPALDCNSSLLCLRV